MNNIQRIEELYKLLQLFARFWQAYVTDKKRDQYEDFWQWGYRRMPEVQAALEACHKYLFTKGQEIYVAPRQIYHPHTPIVEEDYALFAVRVDRCHICKAPTLPQNLYAALSDQAKRAGIKMFAQKIPGEDYRSVCQECVDAGAVEFTCAICGERRNTSLLFDNSHLEEPLCTVCYARVPAKEWDEKVEELEYYDRY